MEVYIFNVPLNLKLFPYIFKEFYTPEELFLNQKAVQFEWGSINPVEVLNKHKPSDSEGEKYHSDVIF